MTEIDGITEGQEPQEFWAALGGRTEYFSTVKAQVSHKLFSRLLSLPDDRMSDNSSHCCFYFIFEIEIILTNKDALDNESKGLEAIK